MEEALNLNRQCTQLSNSTTYAAEAISRRAEEVVVVECCIRGTVVNCQFWTGSCVTWVCGTDLISPLLGGFHELTVGALVVPFTRSGEATVWDTGLSLVCKWRIPVQGNREDLRSRSRQRKHRGTLPSLAKSYISIQSSDNM